MTNALAPLATARPRLDVVRHLALYTAFHKTAANRITHGFAVPVVLVSMMFLQAYVALPGGTPWLHLATFLTVSLVGLLATVDLFGALCLFAFLAPWCWVVGVASAMSPYLVVPIAAAVHGVAWYGTVVTGHTRLEQPIATRAGDEDSNLYFRRGYYLARSVGTQVSWLDVGIQFCIAPLAVVHDVLSLFGLRRDMSARIDRERALVLERLADGRPPLEGP